jgi:hypothetical protein
MTNSMTAPGHRPVKSAAIAASLLALTLAAGCGKKDDGQTAGQKLDSAVTSTEQAAVEAKAKAEASIS